MFLSESKVINIKKSANSRPSIMSSIVAQHAIFTVPQMFGIGKSKSIKAVEKVPPNYLGEQNAGMHDVIEEGKKFAAKCFGLSETSSSKNRKSLWISKTDGAKKSAKNHQP